MIAFIDDHREVYGVEPICKVLPIAPSTYHAHIAQRIDASKRSARAQRDAELKIEVQRVFAENFGVYGARKVWRQLRREGFAVARCTVERLMASLGLQGAIRGKPVRTTISDKAVPCPLDRVNRQFHALRPNALWVSDFTYVATWTGFVYVAFVIDAYARRIVGWRVSRTAHASFVLDALEQALHDRRPAHRGGLVHHSDRGSQYVSIKYTERLVQAGVEPSVGSVGDSYGLPVLMKLSCLANAEAWPASCGRLAMGCGSTSTWEHPEGEVVFQHAGRMGFEGIVSKRLGSRYRSGRSADWLKFKNPEAPAVRREAEEDWGKARR
jgi:putative transposase